MEEKINSTNLKCKGCGSELVFDPKSCNLVCLSCGNVEVFEKDKNVIKHDLTDENKKQSVHHFEKKEKVFTCKNCGGSVVFTNNSISEKCPYCGSNHIFETDDLPGLQPDSILPFALSVNDAALAFSKTIKKRFFVPRALKKNVPTSKIYGVYIPSFCFDAKVDGSYNGCLEKRETVGTGKNARTYYKSFNISGDVDKEITNVVVESSSKINAKQLNAILPYDHSKAYAFDDNFLRGYPIEHYNEDLLTCQKNAKTTMDELLKQNILSTYQYDRVSSFNLSVTYTNQKYLYEVLPVYNFEFTYKNKKYYPLMNAQTGKLDENLPKSPFKVFIATALPIIFILGIILLSMFAQ